MNRRWHIDEAPTTLQLNEIARMLGGEKVSASAIAHARELLAASVKA